MAEVNHLNDLTYSTLKFSSTELVDYIIATIQAN